MSFQYEKILCPDCNGEMTSRTGKFGVFWGCKKFPECKGTRDNLGRSKKDRAIEKGEIESDIENTLGQSESNRNLDFKITFNKSTK